MAVLAPGIRFAEAILKGLAPSSVRALQEARPGLLLAVVWALWGLSFAMGETIPVNDGLGWDGVRFSRMVEGGPDMLRAREINSYYVQRVGPSFAVRAILDVAGVEISNPSIRRGFLVWNLALLSGSLVLLLDAAKRMALGAASRWILCLGLFANPANGRLPIYYATLGDSTAFFLGSLVLWAYLAGRQVAMFVGFTLAIVSWPAAFLLMPLLLWPRSRSGDAASGPVARPPRVWSRIAVVVALPLGWGLLSVLARAVEMPALPAWSGPLVLAVGSNGLQLGCAVAFAVAVGLFNWRRLLVWPSWRGVLAAAVLVGLSGAYVKTFESGSLAFSGVTFFREVLLFVRSKPFAAVIGHTAYYSALAVAAVALWPRVLRLGLGLGPGAFIALASCGMIALDAESRRLNAYWPLVGFVAVMAMDGLWSHRGRFAAFLLASLALSKLWWPLTGPLLFDAAHEPGNYFNTQGPNMSAQAFLVNGLAALSLGLWIVHQAARGENGGGASGRPARAWGEDGITSSL